MFRRARRDWAADDIRNGDSRVRVVRLFGHRDDVGAWEIRDFLKRSVVESQWTAAGEARWPSPLFTDTWKKRHDPVHWQPCLWRGSGVLDSLMSADAQPHVLDVRFPTRRILAIVGDKWTTVALYFLSMREPPRFNHLQTHIPNTSHKNLLQ